MIELGRGMGGVGVGVEKDETQIYCKLGSISTGTSNRICQRQLVHIFT